MDSKLESDVRCQAPNEIRQQYPIAEKARKILQWSPLFDLETVLKCTVA